MRFYCLLLIIPCIFSTFSLSAAGQEPSSDNSSGELTAQTEMSVVNYKPQLFGAVKAKLEFSTYDGSHRFNVRNSRLGVRGNASKVISYVMQIDFSNEGKVSVLDAAAALNFGNFKLSIGQQQYQFSTDLDRGPNTSIFSNRSFLAKFLTTYYGENASGKYTGSIGGRDLGALAAYKFEWGIPFTVQAGAFNGSGANNPDWSNTINVVTRLELGWDDGLGGALSYYQGKMPEVTRKVTAGGITEYLPYKQSVSMVGGEIHYATVDYRIEAEAARRKLDNFGSKHNLYAAHVQGYYQFRLVPNTLTMDHIAPVARWDYGRGIEFISTATSALEKFTANRATVGVSFGFVRKIVNSEFRLSYEKYMLKDKPSDFSKNPLLQDKFTIEIVATF